MDMLSYENLLIRYNERYIHYLHNDVNVIPCLRLGSDSFQMKKNV